MSKVKLPLLTSFLVLVVLSSVNVFSQVLWVRMSSESIVLGAPITLEVKITADVPDGQIWVSSTNFKSIKVDGPKGPCRKRLGPVGLPPSPYSPWYKHDVQLSGPGAKWSEQVGLQGEFYLEEPGNYTVTLSWRSQPLDQYGAMDAKRTLEVKSPGKTFHYLTTLQAVKEVRFQITNPTGVDKEAFDYFKGMPMGYRQEVIAKFPSSTYAAYALWAQGRADYQTYPELGAERDFNHDTREKELCTPLGYESSRKKLKGVIQPWEQLYREFPSFPFRSELLYGLSRCYFQMAEPQKAAPLLKELLTKFPDSDPGKKGMAYRDVLKTHGMWTE